MYGLQGWTGDLPPLNVERKDHACTSFISDIDGELNRVDNEKKHSFLSSPSPVPNPSPKSKSQIQSPEERDWDWG